MSRRQNILSAFVVLLLSTPNLTGSTPKLKSGVRLTLSDSRLSGWAAPELVDWDNDGLQDVVVGYYSGALAVHRNRGLATSGIRFEKVDITRQDSFGRNGVPIWAWRFNKANCVCPGPGRLSPRVLDWNGDGKKDLVIGDGIGAQIRIWINIGSDAAPVFSTHHLRYLPPDAGIRPYHETVQPFFVDWNGDGKRDLIMGRNRGVYVYFNRGSHRLANFGFEQSRLGSRVRGLFPLERLCPLAIDWDADGRQDLLVGSQRGEVWFARNVGTPARPEFNGYAVLQAGGQDIQVRSEARIAVGDLDGDGQNDLIVGDGNGVVRFYQASQPWPMARRQLVLAHPGKATPLELVGTDDARRPLTYHIITQPKHGTLGGTAPKLTYSPGRNFVGRDRFTFKVAAGDVESMPATVNIEGPPAVEPPEFITQPADVLAGIGQAAKLSCVLTGTRPFTYQWTKDGRPLPGATAAVYTVSAAQLGDGGKFTVSVRNAAGSVTSRRAALQVKPLPGSSDDVPVVGIEFESPAIEPQTPGLLTLRRTGKLDTSVTVQLATRRGHTPVIPDLHFVPISTSVTLKAGQASAEIRVTPIDNTLTGGPESLTFLIQPNPAYRLAERAAAARMIFLDDDCPDVGIRALKLPKESHGAAAILEVTATPAPRRDTQVAYTVAGTAIEGVDYEPLPRTVTLAAGETSATIVIKSYRAPTGRAPPGGKLQTGRKQTAAEKSVVVTLTHQPFTYFDFYSYLTHARPRTVRVELAPSAEGPPPPKPRSTPTDSAVARLREEVGRLGWIVFTARADGAHSDLDLFVVRPDGSQLQNITRTPQFDEHSARVSPDGRRMLYRRSPFKTPTPFNNGRLPQDVGTLAMRTRPPLGTLVIADADGGNPLPLGRDGDYAWATWGPQGKQFACLETAAAKGAAQPKDRKGRVQESYFIVIRDADTMQTVQSIPSAGIQSQAVWSPDGKRICGPADIAPGNMRWSKGLAYPLGVGKIASLDLETGRRTAMPRFPDWGPVWATDSNADWFQGGAPQVLHSANNYQLCPAYYCMLWRSGLVGQPSQLVYGEFKRHIWGGCTSPDDQYAVFVISGETWPLGGKLAIIRLADAPIARGRSRLFHEVLVDYFPQLKQGPVLDLVDLPEGFEPHWTHVDLGR